MKSLDLNQMEIVQGGECTKTATIVLMAMAGAAYGVATGGVGYIFGGWALFTMLDNMETCQEW